MSDRHEVRGRERRWSLQLPAVAMPLVDQGIVSAGTFLFNIMLARVIPLGEYGQFAIIVGVVALMQTGCNSLIFYPLSVRAAAVDGVTRQRLALSAMLLTLMMGLPLALLLGWAVKLILDGALFVPVVVMLAAGQVQEASRRGLLSGFRHGAATVGDMVSYLGQPVLLLAMSRHGEMTLPSALWIMAATSLLGAAVQLTQLGIHRSRPLATGALVSDFWSIGHWSLTSNLLGLARAQSLPWLLAALAGPAAAGAFQIAINLVNVVNPIIFGVCNFVPQAASRALHRGYRAAWEASWPAIGAGLPLVTAFAGLLIVAPGGILSLVYGERADPAMLTGPIRILAFAALVNYVGTTVCAYLQGVGQGRNVLVADLGCTVTLMVAGPLLTLGYGLEGGAIGLVLSMTLRAGALVLMAVARTLDRNPFVAGKPD